MRTRTIKSRKFIVLLNNNPFEVMEFVEVIHKSDFDKPSNTPCLGVKN